MQRYKYLPNPQLFSRKNRNFTRNSYFYMQINEVIQCLEDFAPLTLQEDFDNAGLQVGDVSQTLTGALLCLDVTEEIIDEALAKGCNLIVSHHPLLFHPLRSLSGKSYVERCVLRACKHDLVVYSAHTNLDNAPGGVNFHLAERLGLVNVEFLRGGGSGAIGELAQAESEENFLQKLKNTLGLSHLLHSPLTGRPIRKVALCGGNGAFLIDDAIARGADVFLTGEARYNDYYDVEKRLLLAVLGHYETEVGTKELFYSILSKKIPNFALHFAEANTNPVNYM
jgi:dinuclear metal center YbgI/SA1388 family protein